MQAGEEELEGRMQTLQAKLIKLQATAQYLLLGNSERNAPSDHGAGGNDVQMEGAGTPLATLPQALDGERSPASSGQPAAHADAHPNEDQLSPAIVEPLSVVHSAIRFDNQIYACVTSNIFSSCLLPL